MHQVQLKLTDEIYKIQQEEARLKKIFAVSTDFIEGLLKVIEKVQGQLTWLEANATFLEGLP